MLRGQCIQCHAPGWDPALPCARCGHRIEYALTAPTTFQHSYWAKHGVDVVTSPGTYSITTAPPPADTSHFAPGVNLVDAIRWVACSGMIVQPITGGPHGAKQSLLLCIGTTIGGGPFGGTPRTFTGIRAVNLTRPSRLHFYADDVDPTRDLSVQCPTCRTTYPAAALPPLCTTCGSILLR